MTDHDQTLTSVQQCCRDWEPQIRLIGNIEAQAIDAAIGALRAERDALIAERSKLCALADNAASERDAALARVKEVEGLLLLIGERALVDFDDLTLGAVDAAVKEPRRYKEWLKEVYGNAMDAPRLKADNERLRGLLKRCRIYIAQRTSPTAAEAACGSVVHQIDQELGQ